MFCLHRSNSRFLPLQLGSNLSKVLWGSCKQKLTYVGQPSINKCYTHTHVCAWLNQISKRGKFYGYFESTETYSLMFHFYCCSLEKVFRRWNVDGCTCWAKNEVRRGWFYVHFPLTEISLYIYIYMRER